MRALLIRGERVPAELAPAIPLFTAPRVPPGYDSVIVLSRLSGERVLVGSLGAVWSEEDAVRRASGGSRFNARDGDYHLVIVFSKGSLREVYTKYLHQINVDDDAVVGLGKSAARPFFEIYSRKDPQHIIEELFGQAVEEDEPLEPSLLEPIARDLARSEWVDPIRGEGELVSYRVSSGSHYFGVVALVEGGLIKQAWPDSNIHVYPPGLARSVIREIGMVPPSPPLAFHAANSFLGLVEFVGVDSSHIVEAFQGLIREVERVARRYTG